MPLPVRRKHAQSDGQVKNDASGGPRDGQGSGAHKIPAVTSVEEWTAKTRVGAATHGMK